MLIELIPKDGNEVFYAKNRLRMFRRVFGKFMWMLSGANGNKCLPCVWYGRFDGG